MLTDAPRQTSDVSSTSSGHNDGILPSVKVLLKSAGFDDDAIKRAFTALTTCEEIPLPSDHELLSAHEVCDWLKISPSTLWRRKIDHVKLDGLRRFYRSDVQAFLDSRYKRSKKSAKS